MTEVWRTRPYNHCAFTAGPALADEPAARFVELLLNMDADDPEIAEMMRMEHLRKWVAATDDGWIDLIEAVEAAGLQGELF